MYTYMQLYSLHYVIIHNSIYYYNIQRLMLLAILILFNNDLIGRVIVIEENTLQNTSKENVRRKMKSRKIFTSPF